MANSFAAQFRQEVGNCKPVPEGKRRKIRASSADDLFCFGEEEDQDFEDDEEFPGRQLESETDAALGSAFSTGREVSVSSSMESATTAATATAKVPPTAPTLSGVTAAEVVESKQLHNGI